MASASQIAILLTGRYRTLEQTLPALHANLLRPNPNTTLFVACEAESSAPLERLLATYPDIKVGAVLCRPTFRDGHFAALTSFLRASAASGDRPAMSPAAFERAMRHDGLCWSFDYVENSGTLLQYYQAWLLWQEVLRYERSAACHFDTFARVRTDTLFSHPITLSVPRFIEANPPIHAKFTAEQLHKTGPYFEPLVLDPPVDRLVLTLGTEQVWIAGRAAFSTLAQLFFHYGLWDSGTPNSFSSEMNFQMFCKHQNLYHMGIAELDWPVYTPSLATAARYTMTILR